MAAYSMDLRLKAMAAIRRGGTLVSVAAEFGVSAKSLSRWRALHAKGSLEPKRTGPKGGIKLTADDDRILTQGVEDRPGITLEELAGLLGGKVVLSTISRRLARLEVTLKKSRSSPRSRTVPTWRSGDASSPTPGGSSRP